MKAYTPQKTMLFICDLPNEAVSSSDYIALNDGMNNELKRIWKEVAIGWFKILPKGTKEQYKLQYRSKIYKIVCLFLSNAIYFIKTKLS
jgi:hypothetical protein